MSKRESALRQSLKAVNYAGERYYPRQKPLLDELRDERYLLVVFDALRYDYAAEILPQYLAGDLRCVWSAAHDTFQYGKRCWGDRVYQDTYVSGAVPFNTSAGFEREFFNELYDGWTPAETLPNLVEAWEDAWDTSLGTVDPDALTEIAMEYAGRDQLVCHYFQPHAPYIGRVPLLGHVDNDSAEPLTGDPVDKPLWERVKSGAVSPAYLQAAYRANVHRAVETALPVIERGVEDGRRVVVMADHGEMLGEWHPRMVSHPRLAMPAIRRVPWLEVTGTYDGPDGRRQVDESVSEKLKALGYR